MRHHHYRSPLKRAVISFLIVAGMMLVGTIGVHQIEKLSWIDAFYLMSMIVTAQGPMFVPSTSTGKIFISFMSFISVGCVVTSMGFLFGPLLGKLFRVGADKLEEETRLSEKKKKDLS